MDFEGLAVIMISEAVWVEFCTFLILQKKLFEQTCSMSLTVLMNNLIFHELWKTCLAEQLEGRENITAPVTVISQAGDLPTERITASSYLQ